MNSGTGLMERKNSHYQAILTESNYMALIGDPVTDSPIIGTRK